MVVYGLLYGGQFIHIQMLSTFNFLPSVSFKSTPSGIRSMARSRFGKGASSLVCCHKKHKQEMGNL
jgi:hypothetical protein